MSYLSAHAISGCCLYAMVSIHALPTGTADSLQDTTQWMFRHTLLAHVIEERMLEASDRLCPQTSPGQAAGPRMLSGVKIQSNERDHVLLGWCKGVAGLGTHTILAHAADVRPDTRRNTMSPVTYCLCLLSSHIPPSMGHGARCWLPLQRLWLDERSRNTVSTSLTPGTP